MKILKISNQTYEKLLQADKLNKRILSISYPTKEHNKRLLRIEKIKGNLLRRAIY
jgi:hypothetical protein